MDGYAGAELLFFDEERPSYYRREYEYEFWKEDEKDDSGMTAISDAGAAAIFGALKHLAKLKVLRLSKHDLTDASALPLAEAIRNVPTLEKIGVHRNAFTEAGVAAFAKSLIDYPHPNLEVVIMVDRDEYEYENYFSDETLALIKEAGVRFGSPKNWMRDSRWYDEYEFAWSGRLE